MNSLQKIAMVIDADNTQISKIEAVIREISKHGRIVVKRAYGNWKKDTLKNWEGEIKRLATGDGPDRFDADTSPHNHFICRKCHAVLDMDMDDISEVKEQAEQNFEGLIESYSVNFYGVCGKCRQKS